VLVKDREGVMEGVGLGVREREGEGDGVGVFLSSGMILKRAPSGSIVAK